MFDPILFAENIKRLRKLRNMQDHEIAEACGISYYTLREYLARRGNTSVQTVIKMANAFSVSPNELLAGMYSWDTEEICISQYREVMELPADDPCRRLVEVYVDHLSGCPNLRAANDYGERLRICRVEAGYSVTELAGMCGIKPGTLSNIESKQSLPSIEVFLGMRRMRTLLMNISATTGGSIFSPIWVGLRPTGRMERR